MILNSTFCLYNSLCRTARGLWAVPVLQVDNSTFRVLRAAGAHLGDRPDASPRIDISAQPLEISAPHTHLCWQVLFPSRNWLQRVRLNLNGFHAELIKNIMKNHIYFYNGKIYKQKSGGSIGNVLTGALATNFMLWWAMIFK